MTAEDRELVYSSESGFQAPMKHRSHSPATAKNAPPNDGTVRVARERRRASIVSIVHGVDEREIASIAKALRRSCGTGGTAKNGVIEIQGDHRDTIVAWFVAQGRKAKLAGS